MTPYQIALIRSSLADLQKWEKEYGTVTPKEAVKAVMGKGFFVGQTIALLNNVLTDLERGRE